MSASNEIKQKVIDLIGDAVAELPAKDTPYNLHIAIGGDYVGRDQIVLPARESIDPQHPNAVACPQCGQTTWRYSEYCRCGYNLAAHFEWQRRRHGESRVARIALVLGGVGFLALYSAQWLPAPIAQWTIGGGVLGLLLALAIMSRTDGVK